PVAQARWAGRCRHRVAPVREGGRDLKRRRCLRRRAIPAMQRECIELDLSRARPRVNRRGLILLALGIAVAALVVLDYRANSAHRAALELRLDPTPRTRI